MKVKHLFHSGFYIELDTVTLLFDYYKGDLSNINTKKPLYVFVSHHHRDHFSKDIFTINHPNITYILSNDVDGEGIKVLPNNIYTIDHLVITTLESSDLGVAFIVEVDGKKIFHAGDLHWWHFKENTITENNIQQEIFTKEIQKIKDIEFDIFMVVFDVRQEHYIYLGLDYVLANITAKNIICMHYFGQYERTNEILEPYFDEPNIIKVSKRNEILKLN